MSRLWEKLVRLSSTETNVKFGTQIAVYTSKSILHSGTYFSCVFSLAAFFVFMCFVQRSHSNANFSTLQFSILCNIRKTGKIKEGNPPSNTVMKQLSLMEIKVVNTQSIWTSISALRCAPQSLDEHCVDFHWKLLIEKSKGVESKFGNRNVCGEGLGDSYKEQRNFINERGPDKVKDSE
jgi:hypothetical protein